MPPGLQAPGVMAAVSHPHMVPCGLRALLSRNQHLSICSLTWVQAVPAGSWFLERAFQGPGV